MRARLTLLPLVCLCVSWLAPSPGLAQPTWRGDFETGDLSQWGFLLNPTIGGRTYTSVVDDVVAEGAHAGRIELPDDARWPNGLRRVEVQHGSGARTASGETLLFAWSFYVPETLSRDPSQTIGYWETESSYRQVMAFELIGDDLRFATNLPSWQMHWLGDGVVTPATWHRIAMRIVWSTDPSIGTVDVWFDGEHVVDTAHAATLADGNHAFVQMGLLRGDRDFTDVPVIYLDEALEGTSLEDVRGLPPTPVDAGMPPAGDAGSVAGDAGVAAPDAGSLAPGIDAGRSAADAGSSPSAVSGTCSCRIAAAPRAPHLVWLGALALAIVSRGRSRYR